MALNCVGGRSSLLLARVLGREGCLVSYGGMSKQPVQTPTGSFIFDDIRLRGFWMSTWYGKQENFKVNFGLSPPNHFVNFIVGTSTNVPNFGGLDD